MPKKNDTLTAAKDKKATNFIPNMKIFSGKSTLIWSMTRTRSEIKPFCCLVTTRNGAILQGSLHRILKCWA